MRFSIVAAALASASAVIADPTTVYETMEVTITSCAPEVTNCPARSTVTSITSYPVITSSVVMPVYSNTSIPCPTPSISKPVDMPPAPPAPTVSKPGMPPAGPAPSMSKPVEMPPTAPSMTEPVVITVTTCVPTVIYSTVIPTKSAGPPPTEPSKPAGPPPTEPSKPAGPPGSPSKPAGPPVYPSGTGVPPHVPTGTNGPVPTYPVYTGAASSTQATLGLGFVAVVAAFFL